MTDWAYDPTTGQLKNLGSDSAVWVDSVGNRALVFLSDSGINYNAFVDYKTWLYTY